MAQIQQQGDVKMTGFFYNPNTWSDITDAKNEEVSKKKKEERRQSSVTTAVRWSNGDGFVEIELLCDQPRVSQA